jgi:hypothetical protein
VDNRLNENRQRSGRAGLATQETFDGGGQLPSAQQSTRNVAGCQELALRATSGKVVAHVCGDVLRKSVDGSKHFLRQPGGICFDADILDQAEHAGAVRVEVKDRESGITYRATLADFWTHGVKLDRGFQPQVCLPFGFWLARRPGAPVQLGLF